MNRPQFLRAEDVNQLSLTKVADLWDVPLSPEDQTRFEQLQTLFEQCWHAPTSAERVQHQQSFKDLIHQSSDARFDALRPLIDIAVLYLNFPERLKTRVEKTLAQSSLYTQLEDCLQDRMVIHFIDAMTQRGISIRYALPYSDFILNRPIPTSDTWTYNITLDPTSPILTTPVYPESISDEELALYPESLRAFILENQDLYLKMRNEKLTQNQPNLSSQPEPIKPIEKDGVWFLRRE